MKYIFAKGSQKLQWSAILVLLFFWLLYILRILRSFTSHSFSVEIEMEEIRKKWRKKEKREREEMVETPIKQNTILKPCKSVELNA